MLASTLPGPASLRDVRPSLSPKEHGAYGQLGLPLAVGLALAPRAPAAWLFAVAAVSAFVAHEPLKVLLGHRGPRAKRAGGPAARRLLAGCVGIAAVAAASALALAPDRARLGALVPLALATLVLPFTFRDAEKTLAGELLAAAALSSASLPVLLSGPTPTLDAGVKALAWAVAFAGATGGVRGVLAHHRRASVAPGAVVVAAAALAVLAGGLGGAPGLLAAAPVLCVASVVLGLRPHPRHLRRVGWSLLAATGAMAVLVALL